MPCSGRRRKPAAVPTIRWTAPDAVAGIVRRSAGHRGRRDPGRTPCRGLGPARRAADGGTAVRPGPGRRVLAAAAMTLQPVLPWWLMLPLVAAVVGVPLAGGSSGRGGRDPGRGAGGSPRLAVPRRPGAAAPGRRRSGRGSRAAAPRPPRRTSNVFFVVDTSSSIVAEDYGRPLAAAGRSPPGHHGHRRRTGRCPLFAPHLRHQRRCPDAADHGHIRTGHRRRGPAARR